MIRAGLIWAAMAALQDKPLPWSDVHQKMIKLSSYNFTFSGGPDAFSGTFEKGSQHYKAEQVQVAGKGSLSQACADGKWTTLSMLMQMRKGDKTLKRLSQMVPPHDILGQVVQMAQKIDGDSIKGFKGEFGQGNMAKLVRTPWMECEELHQGGRLSGSFAFSCDGVRVVSAEIQVKGVKVVQEKRHYQGVPKPGDPPPVPPGPTWQLGRDGYWYEGVESPVSITLKIELKDFGTAKIPEDVRTKIGLK
jgi:hypothetical protein